MFAGTSQKWHSSFSTVCRLRFLVTSTLNRNPERPRSLLNPHSYREQSVEPPTMETSSCTGSFSSSLANDTNAFSPSAFFYESGGRGEETAADSGLTESA